jgi:23S rRNA pseudouridine2605 synthase
VAERLQKLISQAGIASRRASEQLILDGLVSVNGEIVTELGTKADPAVDHIKVRGKLINKLLDKRDKTCVLLNKPRGYLSSVSDPEGRPLVTDLVKGHGRLYPVGRLDFNTEGLIILTNDGDLANKLMRSRTIPKVYEVKTKGLPNANAINKLRRGIVLDDGFKTSPAEIRELKGTDKNGWYEVTLYQGHNQQIRKMFDAVGHSVVKLRRVRIGGLTAPDLATGKSIELTPDALKLIESAPAKPTASKPDARPSGKDSARPLSRQRRAARPRRRS